MAATASYNHGPGPSWNVSRGAPSRSPSPSSRGTRPPRSQPYVERGDSTGHSYQPYNQSLETNVLPPPYLRVTAPSRTGGYSECDDDWDDDRSVYSDRMSVTQDYYSQILQSDSRASNQLSVYSSRSEINRESWQTDGNARPDSNVDPFSFMKYESPRMQLPKVIVSSPSETSFRNQDSYYGSDGESTLNSDPIIPEPITPPPFQPPPGRVPSAVQGSRNFSRPVRPPAPPLLVGTEEQKRKVLVRNQHRHAQGQGSLRSQSQWTSSPSTPMNSFQGSSSSPLFSRSGDANADFMHVNDELGSVCVAIPAHHNNTNQHSSQSTSPSRVSPLVPPPLSQSSSLSSTSTEQSPRTPQGPQGLVVLPANPPDMLSSNTESLYSIYSFYQLDHSASPSPPATQFEQAGKADGGHIQTAARPLPNTQNPSKEGNSPLSSPNPNDRPADPKTADDYLALGISHHEADRLTESARCFEQSATLNGGCAVGMLMWGLSLRHGWGTSKDEQRAFKWLKGAAEHAVVDLQQGKGKAGREAVRNELILAVYEVGQCFFQGWGVPRDKAMGVSYFQTAAQLGDPDAQQDLAFCLANGKGCKKDRKAAAKWYRAAAAQGASTVGLAWIYKPKYAD